MNKAILILMSGILWMSATAFGAQSPAAGTSVLKLDDNPLRTARKSLAALDVEIAKVDKQILDSQTLASTYKALPNNGLRSSQVDVQTGALQAERGDLVRERENLTSVLVHAEE